MVKGERYQLTIERPAAGGRMIARHDGAIVLVSGAIPGEVVDAEIEKVQRGTVWAATRTVLEPSADRVPAGDGACGGAVFAHIAYERQRAIKSEIISDAFRRLGRLPLESAVEVEPSPADGYRMRARLHVRSGRIGFFREGTHVLCDPATTHQLRRDTIEVLQRLEPLLATAAAAGVDSLELSENIAATERALHLELRRDADASRLASIAQISGLTGATCAHADSHRTIELFGSAYVSDVIAGATLRRHARSFFQGNRFLTPLLVEHACGLIDGAPVLDLYAGVGLFSIAAERLGHGPVTAVEGDRFSSADLQHNADGGDVVVRAEAVERFLERERARHPIVIVDPPRTGLSKEALNGVIAQQSRRVIYVSCDVATLARDARVLVDAGYRMSAMRGFDLFPNTAHVETVISFER